MTARSPFVLLPVLVLMLVAGACGDDGGGSNRALLLKNGPVTEQELRTAFRSEFRAGGDILNLLCRARDFSDDATVMDLTAQLLGEDGVATAEPGPDDVDRVMEIIRQECLALAQ